MPYRSARSVSVILKRAGIPIGARYTQGAIVNREGATILEPTVQVTRLREARYGGMEDTGGVDIYAYDPSGFLPPEGLDERVIEALRAAGLPARMSSGSVRIEDEAPDLDPDVVTGPLDEVVASREFASLFSKQVRSLSDPGDARSVRAHLEAVKRHVEALLNDEAEW